MEDEEGFTPKEQVVDRVPKRIRELQFGILYEGSSMRSGISTDRPQTDPTKIS